MSHYGPSASAAPSVPPVPARRRKRFTDELSDEPPAKRYTSSEAVVEVLIPAKHVGLCVGKQGEQVQAWQRESGCVDISVHREPAPGHPANCRLVVLRGTAAAVEHGRKLVELKIAMTAGGARTARELGYTEVAVAACCVPITVLGVIYTRCCGLSGALRNRHSCCAGRDSTNL